MIGSASDQQKNTNTCSSSLRGHYEPLCYSLNRPWVLLQVFKLEKHGAFTWLHTETNIQQYQFVFEFYKVQFKYLFFKAWELSVHSVEIQTAVQSMTLSSSHQEWEGFIGCDDVLLHDREDPFRGCLALKCLNEESMGMQRSLLFSVLIQFQYLNLDLPLPSTDQCVINKLYIRWKNKYRVINALTLFIIEVINNPSPFN